MRFLLRVILIAALTWLVGWQLPHLPVWPVVLCAFLVGLSLSKGYKRSMFVRKKPPRAFAFLAGFAGVSAVWAVITWRINIANNSLLADQMIDLLSQGGSDLPGTALVAATSLLGGLLGGFGAMTGNLLGEAVKS